jgi:hypothetical protein
MSDLSPLCAQKQTSVAASSPCCVDAVLAAETYLSRVSTHRHIPRIRAFFTRRTEDGAREGSRGMQMAAGRCQASQLMVNWNSITGDIS